jgi:diguanylate cyclase (GGDEF)-like protein
MKRGKDSVAFSGSWKIYLNIWDIAPSCHGRRWTMSRHVDQVSVLENDAATPALGIATLKSWVKETSIARRLVNAGILVLLSSAAVLGTSGYMAYALRTESERLKNILDLQEEVYRLASHTAEFRLAAVDLINDANAGHDAAERQLELKNSAAYIAENFPKTSPTLGTVDEKQRWSRTIREIGDIKVLVLSISPSTQLEAKEAAEDRVEEYNEKLASLTAAIEEAALVRRMAVADKMRQSIRMAFAQIALCSLAALLVGLVLFHGILGRVIPPARQLKNATQRMAAGDLDVTLPESKLSELRELADAIESFRTMARRDREMAYIDYASGLPNRRAFFRAIKHQSDGNPAAFALIDIDRFKQVNDDFGHLTGDNLVSALGARLMSILPMGSIIARFGGDEFAAYVPLPVLENPGMIADRIVREMRVPFGLPEALVSATVSVGIADVTGRDPVHADNSAIMKEVDLALYAAKNRGRNQAVAYDPELAVENNLLRRLESELVRAIEKGQLRMVYQPIISVNTEDREVEALIRWQHPDMGEISPQKLIDAAERSGQMVRLGEWIIDRALDDLGSWPDLTMSINLSAVQLQADGFAASILERCRQRKIVPARLMFEVTETVAIEQNGNAFLNLGLLRGLGFRIALDDFGAGYSSLWLLKSVHFDRLKLDRSLISDLDTSEMSVAVFKAAVALGRSLKMEVVAEGVFEEALVTPLADAGVTHLQGYHYSKPVEAEEVARYYYPTPNRQYG